MTTNNHKKGTMKTDTNISHKPSQKERHDSLYFNLTRIYGFIQWFRSLSGYSLMAQSNEYLRGKSTKDLIAYAQMYCNHLSTLEEESRNQRVAVQALLKGHNTQS